MKDLRFFVIFGAIGVLAILIDYTGYMLFIKILPVIFIAKILSSIISVSANYLLNSKFNFDNRRRVESNLYFKYIAMYSGLILLNALINMLFLRYTGDVQLSFWLAGLIAAATNFLAVRLFFKHINAKG